MAGREDALVRCRSPSFVDAAPRAPSLASLHYGRAGPVARLAAGRVPTATTLPEPDAPAGWRGRLRGALERWTAARWGVAVEACPASSIWPRFRERLGVVPREQARTRLGVAPDDVVLLYVGRGHPAKGLDRLMEAFQVAQVGHGTLRLFLTGRESRIARRARRGGVFLARRPRGLPGPGRRRCAALRGRGRVRAPGCPGGWSMELLEAMAAGLPAVTSGSHRIPEPATGATTVQVEDERPEALARGILELAASSSRRADIGRAVAARAADLDAAAWVPRFGQLYADVVRVAEE